MELVYITLINIIIVFIAFVILNNKIRKNVPESILGKYTKEVENLIIELNQSVEDTVNITEERISQLKKLVKKADKMLKSPPVKKVLEMAEAAEGEAPTEEGNAGQKGAHSSGPTGSSGAKNTSLPGTSR
ncbi:MAG: hypothetical protein ACOC7U_02610, partial [Spirochaetota bacterium]